MGSTAITKRIFEFTVLDPPTPMGRKRFSGRNNGKHFYAEAKDVRSVYHIRQAFLKHYPEMNPSIRVDKIREGAAKIISGEAESLGDTGPSLIAGATRLSITLWHKCPRGMSRKRRLDAWMNPAAMNTKPDLNNVVNQICDALTGYVYVDDRQVRLGPCDKFYALDHHGNDTSPRMLIIVEEL